MLLQGQMNAVSILRYTRDRGFHLSDAYANDFRDRWGLIHARMMHPSFYDPIAMRPSQVGIDYLIPIFTREFYDSIQRWDRRMQRAAFDKVSLLARDWRHGSLRAIALEGLPGYYRIRIATDVRLIYRRGEGNTVEILSLIDREDLDRYIRQARTR